MKNSKLFYRLRHSNAYMIVNNGIVKEQRGFFRLMKKSKEEQAS